MVYQSYFIGSYPDDSGTYIHVLFQHTQNKNSEQLTAIKEQKNYDSTIKVTVKIELAKTKDIKK